MLDSRLRHLLVGAQVQNPRFLCCQADSGPSDARFQPTFLG